MNQTVPRLKLLSPRQSAVLILNRVEDQAAFAEPLLDHYLKNQWGKDKRNRALTTQIVFGTLRMRGYLDWVIGRFYHGNLENMATGLKNVLRSSLFQLFFMDRLPAYAVVNEAVTMTESMFRGRGSLVNAVLRHALRGRDTLPLPDRRRDPLHYLSVVLSHPPWLIKKWLALYGEEETVLLCKANNLIPPVTVRVNALKAARDSVTAEMADEAIQTKPTSFSPDGIRIIDTEQPLRETGWMKEGIIQIQDEGAQLISRFLSPNPGELILDICAGTGGKTLHLAALMGNRGRIVALDNVAHKIEALRGLSTRMGATIIEPLCRDGRQHPPKNLAETFDVVLVDAPCTGTGTLRRNPEIKWRLTHDDIARITTLQSELLDSAARYLKTGGCIVYSTCSLLTEENEDQIKAFLSRHKLFHLDISPRSVPAECIDHNGYLKTFPHRHDMDGFFAARLRKHD